MIRLIIFIIFISLSSCVVSRKQAERKVSRLLEMYPDIIKTETITDTVYEKDTFDFEIPTYFPQDSLMILLDEYSRAFLDSIDSRDTVYISRPSEIRYKILKESSLQNRVGFGRRMLVSKGDTLDVAYSATDEDGIKLLIINHKKEIYTTETKIAPPPRESDFQLLKKHCLFLLFIFVLGLIVGVWVRSKT